MSVSISNTIFPFLNNLVLNNNKDWFTAHKSEYELAKKIATELFQSVHNEIAEQDIISALKIYRINRDLRFSKDKTPYKTHFGGYFGRKQPEFRGGYYIHLEPKNCFIGGGFFAPNKEDLYRIRKEIEIDGASLEKALNTTEAKKYFGSQLWGEELKTAPKNFEKEQAYIQYLRKKQFLLKRNFSDEEVSSDNFEKEIINSFLAMRPFFDFMTSALTTNLNGESLI